MSERIEVWGDWEDPEPYCVLAEGRTAEQAAEVLWPHLIDSGFNTDEYEVYLAGGPQPRMVTVHDCYFEEIGHCENPDCRHGHEEMVYEFYVEEKS